MQKDQSLGIEQTSSVGPAPVESDTPRLVADLIGRTPWRLGLQRDFWHADADFYICTATTPSFLRFVSSKPDSG